MSHGSNGVQGLVSHGFLMMNTRDPLSNDTRRRIYEHINENPGIHLRAIARGVKLDTNHTKYHLIYLEQCGMVDSERVHGHWAFFSSNPMDADLEDLDESGRALLFLLRKKVPRRVVEELLDMEEATHKELQAAAGVSASTLYYHLRRMEEKEVILSRKIHRARYWRLKSPVLSQRFLGISGKPGSLLVESDGSRHNLAQSTMVRPLHQGQNGSSRGRRDDTGSGLVPVPRDSR